MSGKTGSFSWRFMGSVGPVRVEVARSIPETFRSGMQRLRISRLRLGQSPSNITLIGRTAGSVLGSGVSSHSRSASRVR